DGDLQNLLAGCVEYCHPAAGEVEIARAVDRHPVRAQLAKQSLVLQRAVSLDVVGVSLVSPNVGDVENLAIRRPDDAVGLLQVIDDPSESLSIGGQVVDGL